MDIYIYIYWVYIYNGYIHIIVCDGYHRILIIDMTAFHNTLQREANLDHGTLTCGAISPY